MPKYPCRRSERQRSPLRPCAAEPAHREEGQGQEDDGEDTQCLHVAVGRVGEVVEGVGDQIFGSTECAEVSDADSKASKMRRTNRRTDQGLRAPSRRGR